MKTPVRVAWSPGKSHASTAHPLTACPRRGPERVRHPLRRPVAVAMTCSLLVSHTDCSCSSAHSAEAVRLTPPTFSCLWAVGVHPTRVVHMRYETPRAAGFVTDANRPSTRLAFLHGTAAVTQHVQRPLPSADQVLSAAIAPSHVSMCGPARPILSGTLSDHLLQVDSGCHVHCCVLKP